MTTNTLIQEMSRRIGEMQQEIDGIKSMITQLETPEPEEMTGVIYDEPDSGVTIYEVNSDGVVDSDYYSISYQSELLQGNLFYDQASAELESKRRVIRHRLAKFCRDAWVDCGKEMEWVSSKQSKRNLVWYYDSDSLSFDTWYSTHVSDFLLPADSCVDAAKEQFTTSELKLALTGSE